MRYTTLLFDLDHTLIDADVSEATSFDRTMRKAGVDDPAALIEQYTAINSALWAAVERNEITPGEVRVTRFARLFAAAGIDADADVTAADYVHGMATSAELYPQARTVLEVLAADATLALVTNGLSEVQRPRVERLDIGRYFDAIVISGEVGTAKPGPEIYDIAFEALGWPDKATTLMVGDSLSSDIPGGINYGIDTCWYNPDDRSVPAGLAITHVITSLSQLPDLARDGSVPA